MTVGRSQNHITPKWIIDALGEFDLDPCAAAPRPWDCARHNFIEADDGLSQPWRGRVWLNPPFNRYQVGDWIQRLADHGRGTCLLHARVETAWFMPVWKHASGILFMGDRIHFHKPDGTRQPANSGAPPVLVSFGAADLVRLQESAIPGHLVMQWQTIDAHVPAQNRNRGVDGIYAT
jgi:DNA N-6-adenine-methyltransferase (Dam)